MSQENKEVVRRFWEAFSRHDVDGAAATVTEDMIAHNTTNQGREGVRAEAAYWFSAFPDVSVTIEDLVAEGDRVVARVSGTATHGGEFMGMPASGTQVQIAEIDIFRIEDGKIAEIWSAPDVFGLFQQLGMLPSEEPAD